MEKHPKVTACLLKYTTCILEAFFMGGFALKIYTIACATFLHLPVS
jgi:hypothetical protein